MARGVTRVVVELVDDDGSEYEIVFDHESVSQRKPAGSLAGVGSLYFQAEDARKAKIGFAVEAAIRNMPVQPAVGPPTKLELLDYFKSYPPANNGTIGVALGGARMRRKPKRDYGKDGTQANGGAPQPFTDFFEGHDGECEWF